VGVLTRFRLEEESVPKFLIRASYSHTGVEGIRQEGGSSRRDAVDKAISALGGQLESFYFGFGEHDAYVTVDLPDVEAAAAVALTVNARGAVTIDTTVLLTPEQVDDAAKRTVDYRGPGE
jgi:uncharacterized protein with GYD domain